GPRGRGGAAGDPAAAAALVPQHALRRSLLRPARRHDGRRDPGRRLRRERDGGLPVPAPAATDQQPPEHRPRLPSLRSSGRSVLRDADAAATSAAVTPAARPCPPPPPRPPPPPPLPAPRPAAHPPPAPRARTAAPTAAAPATATAAATASTAAAAPATATTPATAAAVGVDDGNHHPCRQS